MDKIKFDNFINKEEQIEELLSSAENQKNMLELLIHYNVNIMIFSRQFEELREENNPKKFMKCLIMNFFIEIVRRSD
jgi:hypothetical protein